MRHITERTRISFRAVNRRGHPGYDSGLQRHHLLPRQLLSKRCFGHMFDRIGREKVRFDDFRANGILLPAKDDAAVRMGLPLHRGPHREYNGLVIERVGQIEANWSLLRDKAPEAALEEALMRLSLLQSALRRRLLAPRGKPFSLNSKDPGGKPLDFSELDAMADALWSETQTVHAVEMPMRPDRCGTSSVSMTSTVRKLAIRPAQFSRAQAGAV